MPLAAREQRKLGDLGPRHGLVGAEPRHEIGARVAVDLEVCLVELLVDQIGDRALVAVARQRRGRLVALEQFAQTRVGPECSRLDDERAGERRFEQRLQRGNVEPRAGGDAHHLAFGEHGDGAKLDLEPRRIFREILLVEANDLHRVLALTGKDIGERSGALGHEPRVRTVDEPGAAGGVERFEDALKRSGLVSDHGNERPLRKDELKPPATDRRRCGP